jgi:hypothetical protein
MKLYLVIISLLAICLAAQAQSLGSGGGTEHFQEVGGDYGRSILNNFKAQAPQPAEKNVSDDFWSWGAVPKGKAVVNGKLVDATTVPVVNWSANWMGDMTNMQPIYLNGSSPYGNYGQTNGNYNPSPLTPMALSDDPWILAQQLERPVMVSSTDYPRYFNNA